MREAGFYWVKMLDHERYAEDELYRDWVPAHWFADDQTWAMMLSDASFDDDEVMVGDPIPKMVSTPEQEQLVKDKLAVMLARREETIKQNREKVRLRQEKLREVQEAKARDQHITHPDTQCPVCAMPHCLQCLSHERLVRIGDCKDVWHNV